LSYRGAAQQPCFHFSTANALPRVFGTTPNVSSYAKMQLGATDVNSVCHNPRLGLLELNAAPRLGLLNV